MDSAFLGAVTAIGCTVAFFGGLALIMWIDSKGKAREKELNHIERLKALETGQTLPDAEVARARSESSRAWAAALTAIFVSLGMVGVALGATALIFKHAAPAIHLPLVSVVWGICGLVALVAVSVGMKSIRPRERARVRDEHANTFSKRPNAEAIRAADVSAIPVG
jgi:hypothetical protein